MGLDPTLDESSNLDGAVRMVMSGMGGVGKVTTYEQRGPVEVGRVGEVEDLCKKGCMVVYEIMRKALIDREEKREEGGGNVQIKK